MKKIKLKLAFLRISIYESLGSRSRWNELFEKDCIFEVENTLSGQKRLLLRAVSNGEGKGGAVLFRCPVHNSEVNF